MCEECKKSDAVFYSSLFKANMCEPCSKRGHAGIELARKHQLLPISKVTTVLFSSFFCSSSFSSFFLSPLQCMKPMSQSPATFGPCQHHPSRVVEYYCPTCSLPVCVDCKMVLFPFQVAGVSWSNQLCSIHSGWQPCCRRARQPQACVCERSP